MFIGRERELASLNRLYNSGKFEMWFFTAAAVWEKPH